MTTQTSYRLPTSVRPQRYEICLTPNLDDFTFTGEQSVQIEVSQPTSAIVVNAAELEIGCAAVVLGDGRTVEAADVTYDEEAETATLAFAAEVPVGAATLTTRFRGILNDQLRGFYRCQYAGTDGEERFLATTQFEATDARRAFPCWDEPSAKAVFQVTLVAPPGMVALSNTPSVSETALANDTKAVQFAETPKMSTYLLAFVVGDMASVEGRSDEGTLVRVWATRGKEAQGRFALDVALRLLDYLNWYFGIPYPLEKLDHVAIPDFAAGAMENWGAITYRETALLYDEANSAANTQQRIAEVVAHEMAHMWFGDLVTMEWWDDLWLNESFASWMGNKAVDHLYPAWDMWTQFVFQDTNSGLSLDGLKNSHPIEVSVGNPAEIGELFDAISYNKGGAVLRMLEAFLGEDTFRSGIHNYLSAHLYGNARTEDLWAGLEKASGQPVTRVMNTWIKQPGYPVLQVETARDDEGTSLTLSQRRFLYDQLLDPTAEDPSLWQVPVSASGGSGSDGASILMDSPKAKLSLAGTGEWAKVNAGQTGFYRVSYSVEEWDRLRGAVQARQLSATDRLGLQNDAFALARAGQLPPTVFLSLSEAYRGEEHASVWSELATSLRSLENLILTEPYHPQFEALGRDLFAGVAERVGWQPKPGEGHLDLLLRSLVQGQLGGFGDTETLEEAGRRFQAYLSDPSSLSPDLRGVVYALTAQQGDDDTYQTMLQLGQDATLQEEKLRFFRSLAAFRREDLLQRTLEHSLGSDVRTQDAVSLLTSVAGNPLGRGMAWEFIKENWQELDRRYGAGGFAIMRLVAVTGGFTTLEQGQDVERFFRDHPTPGAARTIEQSLERIRLNVKWLELYNDDLAEWFEARG